MSYHKYFEHGQQHILDVVCSSVIHDVSQVLTKKISGIFFGDQIPAFSGASKTAVKDCVGSASWESSQIAR